MPLWPITFLMEKIFAMYADFSGSVGVGVLLLAATFAIISRPIQQYGRRLEVRIAEKNRRAREDISALDSTLKGEKFFEATDAIYLHHGFHPAYNILSGASFLFQLPFLISAVLLFIDGDTLQGKSFGMIADLSLPDDFLSMGDIAVNLLPFMVLLWSVADAYFFYADNLAAQRKFMFIAVVIFMLIYSMPSGLVLYWLALSMCTSFFNKLAR